MKKENKKKSKLIYVLLSIAASIFLWVYVVTVVSTEKSETFYNIPVTFTGLEALRNEKLMVSEGLNTTVNIRLTGRRVQIEELNKDNILVTVDVSKINAPGTYNRNYSVSFPTLPQTSGITEENRQPQTIPITVEELLTMEIPVSVVFQGTMAEDYALENMVPSFESISVTGTAERVRNIAEARIVITDKELSKTTSSHRSYSLLDYDGKPVDTRDLVVDEETVNVTVNVVKYKEIPLIMEFNPGGGATEANVDWKADPPTIVVSGDESLLDQYNYILLSTQNLSALVADTTETYPIRIPDGLTNETGVAEAKVTMKLNGLNTTKITVTRFDLINVPSGFHAEAVTKSLDITVRGTPQDVNSITASNLRVIVNLSTISAAKGTYKIENVLVNLDGHPDSGIMGTYTIMVKLITEQEYLDQLAEAAEKEAQAEDSEATVNTTGGT